MNAPAHKTGDLSNSDVHQMPLSADTPARRPGVTRPIRYCFWLSRVITFEVMSMVVEKYSTPELLFGSPSKMRW